MMAIPALDMIVFTSAKSRLTSPGRHDQIRNTFYRMQQDLICLSEHIHHPGIFLGQPPQPVIGNGDNRVGNLFQGIETFLGLAAALFSFKGKRLGNHGHRECTDLFADFSDYRRRTRTRYRRRNRR